MFERLPKPSEIMFVASLCTMTTPAISEIIRSINASDRAEKNCPPLMTESTYNQKRHEILAPIIEVSEKRKRHSSMPTPIYFSQDIQQKLDELDRERAQAEKTRNDIVENTAPPIKNSVADGIGFFSTLFALGISIRNQKLSNKTPV